MGISCNMCDSGNYMLLWMRVHKPSSLSSWSGPSLFSKVLNNVWLVACQRREKDRIGRFKYIRDSGKGFKLTFHSVP